MKLVYRISTIVFILVMFLTAITDLARMDFVMEQMDHLGYPDFLPFLIGSGKLIGIALLSLPKYAWFKEWAYAGFTVLFVSATASHAIARDPVSDILPPLFMEALLLTSYISMLKTIKPPVRNRSL